MYTYGYLFYIPINVIYVSIFAIKGILKKRKKEYYFFILIFGIYLNFFIEKAFFPIFTDGASYYVTLSNYNKFISIYAISNNRKFIVNISSGNTHGIYYRQ